MSNIKFHLINFFTNMINLGELNGHIATHSGAHPYVCDTCGHSFTKPTSLKKHKRIHLGVKPFECDVCSMK